MSHLAYYSCETGFWNKLEGYYEISTYSLIPCKFKKENQITGTSQFVLTFPFSGVTSDDESKDFFVNLAISVEEAKLFIAWMTTITRQLIDLSYTNLGVGQSFGPAITRLCTEPLSLQELETIFHTEPDLSNGKYIDITRPNYNDRFITMELFQIPSDFERYTKKAYALPELEKQKFFDSCFSYQFALQNIGRLPSVSLVSLVNCVEIMMRDEKTSGYCEDAEMYCPLKSDVMKKFRKFFEENLEYPLPSEQKKFLNQIYGKRSSFVHRALLGIGSMRGPLYMRLGKDDEVIAQVRKLETLVNVGLITWLEKI